MATEPQMREVDIPQYLKIFGEMTASKAQVTKELMPAISRIIQEIPKWAEKAEK